MAPLTCLACDGTEAWPTSEDPFKLSTRQTYRPLFSSLDEKGKGYFLVEHYRLRSVSRHSFFLVLFSLFDGFSWVSTQCQAFVKAVERVRQDGSQVYSFQYCWSPPCVTLAHQSAWSNLVFFFREGKV